MNLITGKTGTPHVSANDDGTIWRAITGYETCVFDYGSNFAATSSGYTLTIADGLGMNQGRMFSVNEPETVTLDSIASGYRRIDYVCMKITIDPITDVCTAEWAVIKGEAVSGGNPRPPIVTEGDIDAGDTEIYMVLYEVLLQNGAIASVRETFALACLLYWDSTKEITCQLTSALSQSVSHGILNVSEWSVIEAYATDGTSIYPLPYVSASTGWGTYSLDLNYINFRFGSSWAGYTAHVVFGKRR